MAQVMKGVSGRLADGKRRGTGRAELSTCLDELNMV